ncbi:MAG: Metal-dependent hydrolase, partial [uncultured Rubrobacteraceae bacterium]
DPGLALRRVRLGRPLPHPGGGHPRLADPRPVLEHRPRVADFRRRGDPQRPNPQRAHRHPHGRPSPLRPRGSGPLRDGQDPPRTARRTRRHDRGHRPRGGRPARRGPHPGLGAGARAPGARGPRPVPLRLGRALGHRPGGAALPGGLARTLWRGRGVPGGEGRGTRRVRHAGGGRRRLRGEPRAPRAALERGLHRREPEEPRGPAAVLRVLGHAAEDPGRIGLPGARRGAGSAL